MAASQAERFGVVVGDAVAADGFRRLEDDVEYGRGKPHRNCRAISLCSGFKGGQAAEPVVGFDEVLPDGIGSRQY